MEKEQGSVRLVFFDSFIYADHSYKFLPEHRPKAIEGAGSTEIAQKRASF